MTSNAYPWPTPLGTSAPVRRFDRVVITTTGEHGTLLRFEGREAVVADDATMHNKVVPVENLALLHEPTVSGLDWLAAS